MIKRRVTKTARLTAAETTKTGCVKDTCPKTVLKYRTKNED
jgi:hypothetical protein